MPKLGWLSAAAALVALWLAVTAVTAVARGDGEGGVFLVAVVLLAVLAVGFGVLSVRLARRPRR